MRRGGRGSSVQAPYTGHDGAIPVRIVSLMFEMVL
jgi:hypothetical protein